MKKQIFVLTALLGSCCLSLQANAMSCGHPSPSQHIASSEVIFYGKSHRGYNDATSNKMVDGKFTVLRAYKGVQAKTKTITIRYMDDNGGNRGWGFRVDRPVLIFAYPQKSDNNDKPVTSLNFCTMIPYHGRADLHAEYWDILATMK